MTVSLICSPFFIVQVLRSYFRRADPFFDEQENHSLIGVANVFLSCLFYDVKLQYAVPIINQTGEVGSHKTVGSLVEKHINNLIPVTLLINPYQSSGCL